MGPWEASGGLRLSSHVDTYHNHLAVVAAALLSMTEDPGPFAGDGDALQTVQGRTARGTVRRRWPVVGTVLGTVGLLAGFYLEHVRGRSLPFVTGMEPVDWLLAFALLVGAAMIASLLRRPQRVRLYLRRVRERPAALLSLTATASLLALGLVGPLFVSEPTDIVFSRAYLPPVGATVDTQYLTGSCLGPVTDGRCQGTLRYPFGTTRAGRPLLPFVVLGARTVLEIIAVTTLVLVPLGVGVGLFAGVAGGRTDAVLMVVADVFATLPAVLVYILFWRWNAEYRLMVLILAFGLVNWGGLARSVRNQTVKLRDRAFVRAARLSGAGRLTVAWRHLLPNVSRQVFSTLALQVPLLVVTEAALSFIVLPSSFGEGTLGDPTVVSWGQLLYIGIREEGLFPAWWITTIPTAALVLATLSLAVFWRSLSDVFDPTRGY
jgi:peptide/nickel transport system permease protein